MESNPVSSEQTRLTDAEQIESRPSPLSILFAEDSKVTRQLIHLVLSKRGHHVEAVEDGERALDALRRGAYDVALLDLHLPKIDGLEVVRRYRTTLADDHKQTRFVGFTADVEGLMARLGNSDILDLIVGKPVDVMHLCNALEEFERQDAPRPTAESLPVDRPERRAAQRMKVAAGGGTTLLLDSGERFTCIIHELSLAGAALEVEARPKIGQRVTVGRTEGRVVRHTPTGIAVEFTRGLKKPLDGA